MNWFKAHINWTVVLILTIVNIAIIIAYNIPDPVSLIIIISSVVLYILSWIWALVQKGRSLWFIPLAFTNVLGFGVILALENKKSQMKK